MQLLKIISRLLDYPDPLLWRYRAELVAEVHAAIGDIPATVGPLVQFIDELTRQDMMDAQEQYSLLFDRGRALSLLLFEHVHGESRDRGQAMVDLMSRYEAQGFAISVKELPDYIPLFLEYLSQRPHSEIVEWLTDAGHILALLAARLRERQSPYAVLFECLLEIGGIAEDGVALDQVVQAESRDDTPEAMDKIWEDEAIRFGSGQDGQCGSQRIPRADTASAVKWVAGTAPASQTNAVQ